MSRAVGSDREELNRYPPPSPPACESWMFVKENSEKKIDHVKRQDLIVLPQTLEMCLFGGVGWGWCKFCSVWEVKLT